MNKYEIFEEVENKVVDWGYDKGILHAGPSTKQRRLKQYQKTEEEVDELFTAITTDNREEAIDAIGDILVTLIMQTRLWKTDLYECLNEAYEVINKRTGRMVDGIFVKDK